MSDGMPVLRDTPSPKDARMVKIRMGKSLYFSRFRNSALIALTSLSLISSAQHDVSAGWFSTPTNEKPAEDAEPKSGNAARDLIRKLTKDAKAEESAGNLDKAIALADRALRVSERAANSTKSDPDSSPAATARYANDLRLKKAEKSVKRVGPAGAKPENESAAKIARAPARPKPTGAELNPPVPKKITAAKNPEATADRKDGVKSQNSVAAATSTSKTQPQPQLRPRPAATINPQKPLVAAADSSKAVQQPVEKPIARPVAKLAAPATAIAKSDDFDDFAMPMKSTIAKRESSPARQESKPRAEDNFDRDLDTKTDDQVKVVSFDDDADDTPQVKPRPPQTTTSRSTEAKGSTSTAPFKIRRQYATNAVAETLQPSKSNSKDVDFNEPAITPKANLQYDDSLLEPRRIVPAGAEDQSSADARGADKLDDELELRTTEGVHETHSRPLPADDFPVAKAREMKRRIDTAEALEPGAVAPDVDSIFADESVADSQADNDASTFHAFRLRNQRKPSQKKPAGGFESVVPDVAHQPVLGQTSMIKWRAASNEAKAAERSSSDDRFAPPPADLRQSLRENADFTQPKISRTSKPAVAASKELVRARAASGNDAWWTDAAPSAEEPSGSEAATSNTITFNDVPPIVAPIPPTDDGNVNVHYERSIGMRDRRRQRDANHESVTTSGFSATPGANSIAPSSYSEDVLVNIPTPELEGSTATPDVTVQSNEKKAPAKGMRFIVGAIASTMVSMLSAVGLATFIAGLWVARIVIRSKTPE